MTDARARSMPSPPQRRVFCFLCLLLGSATAARLGGTNPIDYIHGKADPKDHEKILQRIAEYRMIRKQRVYPVAHRWKDLEQTKEKAVSERWVP